MNNFSEEEIKAAKNTRRMIVNSENSELKSIYMAGEICMWDELRQTPAQQERWVSVNDGKLPEHEKVLVKFGGDTVLIGICDSQKEWGIYWMDGQGGEDPDRPVTHWMPLPAPPISNQLK